MRSFFYLILILSFGLSACKQSKYLFSKGKVEPFFKAEKNRAGKAYYLDIPFQYDQGLIFLPVEIGGVTYRFLFDSGAPMVLSPEIVNRNELMILKKAWIKDSQGKGRSQNFVKLQEMRLDSLTFYNLTAVEVDLAYSPVLACLGIDGIVGANLMRQGYWEIDFDKKLLRFSNRRKFWQKQAEHTIPFGIKSTGTPVLNLRIGSGMVKGITFDSGSTGYLSLPETLYGGDDEPVNVRWGYLSSGIYGSLLDTARERDLAIKLDSAEYSIPIKFETGKGGKLLGMSFLENFLVQLDWDEQQIHLSPRQKINWQNDSTFGIIPHYQDSVLIVGSLNRNISTLYPALSVGDTITHLGEKSVYPLGRLDFCSVLEEYRERKSMALSIKSKSSYRFEKGLRYSSKSKQAEESLP